MTDSSGNKTSLENRPTSELSQDQARALKELRNKAIASVRSLSISTIECELLPTVSDIYSYVCVKHEDE